MKVKATKTGYYNLKRRYEGQVFELKDEKLFSSRWMEKVEGENFADEEIQKPVKKSGKPAPKAVSKDEEVI